QQNSNLVYQTTGNAPYRVFTVEWKNIKWDYQCNAAVGSFQLILHETTNIVEFAYQNLNGTPSATAKASIGLTTNKTGFGSFISLQDNSTNPAISKFNENNSITSFPASNSVYRFTPHASYNNNLIITTLYSLGTICKNGESYSFSANVFNAGKQNAVHVPVTLSVAGNNSFSTTKYIENLAPGIATNIVFDAFVPGVNSTDKLSVSIPSDEDNSDNLISKNIRITNNQVSNVTLGNNLYQNSGIGNNVPSEFATRFTTQNFKSINHITLYFSNESNSVPFDITVYDANGLDNKPGAILWQQKGLTSQPGSMDINVSTGITVHGQYFIAVTQSSTATISYAYESESPLQTNTYYYKTPLNSSWIDIASENNKYKLIMGVQYDNTLPVSATRVNGYKLSEKNVLKWNTYTEVNNDHFVIERSTNGHDFTPIATVNSLAPMGNSTSTLTYTFVDQATQLVNTYYRLKQVNKQADYAISDVIMLKGDGKIPFVVNNIYPNPVESTLKINYSTPNAGNSTVVLIDAVGRIVDQTVVNSMEGDNQQQIELSKLSKGQYFLQFINSAGKSNVIKVVKK
ncbi:MAG: T9SS type A sorting domain-containing protein, partial [Bacteroidota bacterium]